MGEVNPPSPLANTLKGTCPHCGQGRLYKGPVQFAAACRNCGLDFDSFNVGDGPAAFLILIVGAIVATSAILVDLSFNPPWWVHLIWVPIGIALTLYGLRIGKAALLFQEYRHRAREGRLVE